MFRKWCSASLLPSASASKLSDSISFVPSKEATVLYDTSQKFIKYSLMTSNIAIHDVRLVIDLSRNTA